MFSPHMSFADSHVEFEVTHVKIEFALSHVKNDQMFSRAVSRYHMLKFCIPMLSHLFHIRSGFYMCSNVFTCEVSCF
jgi:hypothetical protein